MQGCNATITAWRGGVSVSLGTVPLRTAEVFRVNGSFRDLNTWPASMNEGHALFQRLGGWVDGSQVAPVREMAPTAGH
jgi:hypothetical protein